MVTLYFHCADEGEKIDCIKHNPVVSISAVSRSTPKYEDDKSDLRLFPALIIVFSYHLEALENT